MAREAIQVMYFNYKVELLGGDKPRIRVTLHRTDQPREYFMSELPQGSPITTIKISTDSLVESDMGKLSIQIGIVAQPTPKVLAGTGKSNSKNEIFLVHSLSSSHQPNTANRFFEACENIVKNGGTIPITVLNSRGRVLCVLQAKEVGRFVWSEVMQQMEELRRTASAGSKTVN